MEKYITNNDFVYVEVSYQDRNFEFESDLIKDGIALSGRDQRERAKERHSLLKEIGTQVDYRFEEGRGDIYKFKVSTQDAITHGLI